MKNNGTLFHRRLAARALFLVLLLGSIFLSDRVTLQGSAAVLPTRTPIRVPTRTPTPRAATLSKSSLTKSKPADLLSELFVGGRGAGGEETSLCNRSSSSPYNVSAPRQELVNALYAYSCGWTADEQVDIRIQYPNGKVLNDQVTTYKDHGQYYASASLQTKWEDPTGIYQVTFTGPSGQVRADINVFRPTAPRVIQSSGLNLLLYHFSPGENVRLLIYGDCPNSDNIDLGCLNGWQMLQVDRQGNLSLKFNSDLAGTALGIVGEKSGELKNGYLFLIGGPYSYEMVKESPKDSYVLRSSCPGAPPQRLKTGWIGKVCTKVDRVKLRQQPSRSGAEIVRLEPGTLFGVVAGPSCSDNWSWWKVELDDGRTGWLAEGGDSTDPYFICPDF